MNANLSGVKDCIKDLWYKVNDPKYDELIHWNESGTGFLIVNEALFAYKVLNKKNFASYQRNLYHYGFRKLKETGEFTHPKFNRAHPELLKEITCNRNSTKRSRKKPKLVQNMMNSCTGQGREQNVPTTGAGGESSTFQEIPVEGMLQEGESLAQNPTTSNAEQGGLNDQTTGAVGGVTRVDGIAPPMCAAHGLSIEEDFFKNFGFGVPLAQNPTTSNAEQGGLNDQTTGAVGGVTRVDSTALHVIQEGESTNVGAARGLSMDDLFNELGIGNQLAQNPTTSNAEQGGLNDQTTGAVGGDTRVDSTALHVIQEGESTNVGASHGLSMEDLFNEVGIGYQLAQNPTTSNAGQGGLNDQTTDVLSVLQDPATSKEIPMHSCSSTQTPQQSHSSAADRAGCSVNASAKARKIKLFQSAAKYENIKIMYSMLSGGLDVNSSDGGGTNALMVAAEFNKPNAFKLLIKHGADVFSKDKFGQSVLHYAAAGGNTSIIAYLVQAGIDVNTRNSIGSTPLLSAVGRGQSAAFEQLINLTADPLLTNENDWSLLHAAALNGNTSIIEKLLALGLDIHARDKEDRTPLEVAMKIGMEENRSEAIDYLFSKEEL